METAPDATVVRNQAAAAAFYALRRRGRLASVNATAVLAPVNAEDPDIDRLTDREIARRAGTPPHTIGKIRRSTR